MGHLPDCASAFARKTCQAPNKPRQLSRRCLSAHIMALKPVPKGGIARLLVLLREKIDKNDATHRIGMPICGT